MDVGIKIKLKSPSDFLVIKETLTRIGVASYKTKTLYQTVHILHKKGEYYLVHFLEMFILDGKRSTITEADYEKRNLIAMLLQDWGLVAIDDSYKDLPKAPTSAIKILSYKDKDTWETVSKYTIGNKNSH